MFLHLLVAFSVVALQTTPPPVPLDLSQVAVGGIALIPLVIGLVQVIKKAGVTGEKLMYVAVAIGLLAGLAWRLPVMFPVTQPWVELIVYIVAMGVAALSGTGLYDLGKSWFASTAEKSVQIITNAGSKPGTVDVTNSDVTTTNLK